MSLWTHIAATIRIDDFSFGDDPLKPPHFGITCDFDSSEESWEDCSVPCGSEGSLQYKLIDSAENTNTTAKWVATFWGDLRDFGSDEDVIGVIEYFNKCIENRCIRNGVLEIAVEYQPSRVFVIQYDEELEKSYWRELKF